jgi:hypothetical protein
MMKARALAVTAGLLVCAASADAQHGKAFAVAAAGGWSSPYADTGLVGGAGGGEAVLGGRLGVGGEIGVLVAPDGKGLVSLAFDGRLRVTSLRATSRTRPFVLAGYSFIHFFESAAHGWNVGAGADYRVSTARAIRVEFKDIIEPRPGGSAHYWAARVGLVFR